ncbi:MAG: hypothetical protein HY010_23415 [Acidobacteria bacterium]|nr:hypothetical protein [Acidobacteriota bacterium]
MTGKQMQLAAVILLMSALCCAQAFYHARTDLKPIKPIKMTWSRANVIVVDPNFGSQIVRMTDRTTFQNRSLQTADSGTPNLWNKDSTMLVVRDTNATSLVMSFDPATMKSRLRTDWQYAFETRSLSFSHLDPQILFLLTSAHSDGPKTILQRVDFRQQKISEVYDFANCLPPSVQINWSGTLSVNNDDTVFTAALSDNGQDLGIYAGTYTIGQGCRVLNTKTGEVTGDWGPSGKISVPDRFGLHAMSASAGGDVAILSSGKCWTACADGPYFWNIPTLNVKAGVDLGHSAKGYLQLITAEHFGQWRAQPYDDPTDNRTVIPARMLPSNVRGDKHASWNNVDPNDLNPFFSTNSRPWPPEAPWEDEVIGVDPVSGIVYRFSSTYNSGRSRYFIGKYAVGVVSQDGKFLAFTSDALKTLGLDAKGRHRVDVFVVRLE